MTGSMTDTESQSQILPIAEAARILNVSERTIWRRVKSGKLETIDMNGRTCVQINRTVKASDASDNNVSMTGNRQAAVVTPVDDRLVNSLQDRIRDLKDENERLWSEIEAKQGTIDSLTKMLPAPKDSDTVTDTPVSDEVKAIMQTHTELCNQLRSSKRVIWPYIVAGVALLTTVGIFLLTLR